MSTSLMEELAARDLRGASSIIYGFVRQDLLRARYLREVATSMQLEATGGPYNRCVNSLRAIEADLQVILTSLKALWGRSTLGADDLQKVDEKLGNVISRHRVTTRALWTACDFLGPQLGSSSVYLEKYLRRSLEGAQRLVEVYAVLVPKVGAQVIDLPEEDEVPSKLSAIVSFEHRRVPQVDFNSIAAESGESRELCVFVELPYWYAVRHRHLATLAHELGLAWIHSVAKTPGGKTALRRLIDPTAEKVRRVLMREALDLRAMYGQRFSAEAERLAHGHAQKLLADLLAYSVAGPAYLYSFFMLEGALARFGDDFDYTRLFLEVRFLALSRAHSHEFDSLDTEWKSTFAQVNSEICALIAERRDGARRSYGKLRHHMVDELLNALSDFIDEVWQRAGSAWRDRSTDEPEIKGNIPPANWDEVAVIIGEDQRADVWRSFFEDAGWRLQALPCFLWGQYVDQRRRNLENVAAMGRIAQPLWDGALRPDRKQRRVFRGRYCRVDFYRVAPGGSVADLVDLLSQSTAEASDDEPISAAGVLGSFDMMTIEEDFSPNVAKDFPPAKRDSVKYVCESHIVCEVRLDGPPQAGPLAARFNQEGTHVVTQFVLAANSSLAEFLAILGESMVNAPAGLEVTVVLASLGWEDAIVVWHVEGAPEWGALSAFMTHLGHGEEGIVRHSFTQVIVGPVTQQLVEGVKSFRQPANFSGAFEVQFAGVQEVDSLEQALHQAGADLPNARWGQIDVAARWSVKPTTDLASLWIEISGHIKNELAVSMTASWLPGEELPRKEREQDVRDRPE